jgi:hypothetical protein
VGRNHDDVRDVEVLNLVNSIKQSAFAKGEMVLSDEFRHGSLQRKLCRYANGGFVLRFRAQVSAL